MIHVRIFLDLTSNAGRDLRPFGFPAHQRGRPVGLAGPYGPERLRFGQKDPTEKDPLDPDPKDPDGAPRALALSFAGPVI